MSDLSLQRFAIEPFVVALAASCPAIRAVWCIGERADARPEPSSGSRAWNLLAFANPRALLQLRSPSALYRPDVRLCVVTDGDRFQRAWGDAPDSGSLMQWDWVETAGGEAFYSEARWSGAGSSRTVERIRRRALCLWRSQDAATKSPAAHTAAETCR